jgi:hypothetical protein
MWEQFEIQDAIRALTLLMLPDGPPEERVRRAAVMAENYGQMNDITHMVDDYLTDPEDAVAVWL